MKKLKGTDKDRVRSETYWAIESCEVFKTGVQYGIHVTYGRTHTMVSLPEHSTIENDLAEVLIFGQGRVYTTTPHAVNHRTDQDRHDLIMADVQQKVTEQ